MFNNKIFYNKSFLFTNLTFSFFPIAFFFGNPAINLNFLLFCLLAIYNLKSKIFSIKFNLPLKIIAFLFFIIFLSTAISFFKSLFFTGYEYSYLERLIKSVIFFRFFLFLILIYLLVEFDILNFKYFFLISAFSSAIMSLDIIYQYYFGVDILGFKSAGYFNSGFFGEEKVAGGYIQKFSFFSLLFVNFFFKDKKNICFILTSALIIILGLGIIFSGNRMPFLLFLLGLFSVFLLNNKIRKVVLVSIIGLFFIFKFLLSNDPIIHTNYSSFSGNAYHILIDIFQINKDSEEKKREVEQKEPEPGYSIHSGHRQIFLTSIDTWKKNKVFGNGIKSFRIDCHNILKEKLYRMCSNHPHNYYLEILTETGIVGLILILAILTSFLFFIIKNFNFFKGERIEEFILLSAIISLLIEIFPVRSSGSFFTTGNATYILLITSIILCYKKLLKK